MYKTTKEQDEEYFKYANSMERTLEEVTLYLSLGARTPQNEKEKKLLKEIKEIEKRGGTVYIPSD